MRNVWYVYVLQNVDKDFIYVGLTRDIRKRFNEHNDGKVQSTEFYVPLELKIYIVVPTLRKARELEKYLKNGSGKTILKRRFLDRASIKRESLVNETKCS